MLTLQRLLSLKAIPSDTALVDEGDTITLSSYKALGKLGLPEHKCMIIDKADWIAYSASTNTYFSSNSKGEVGKYVPAKGSFIVQTLRNNKLKTKLYQNLKKGEDVKMDNKIENLSLDNLNDMNINLDDLTKELENDNLNAQELGVNPLHAFDGEASPVGVSTPKANAASSNAQKVKDLITQDLDDSAVVAQPELNIFNRLHGRLIGYITQNDAMIKFGTSSKIKMDSATRAPKLKSGVGQDIKDRVARGEQVDSVYYEKEVSLTYRQTSPGKVLGGVISVPEGGYFTISEVNSGQTIKPEKDKTDLKYVLFDKDSLTQVVAHLFGAEIQESEETFGASAAKVVVKPKVRVKTSKDSAPQDVVQMLLKTTAKGRKEILPNTYLPLKTFKTINIGKTLSEEDCQELNKSSFYNIFRSTQNTSSRHSFLKEPDKSKIWQNEDNTYGSVFFTTDSSKREALRIKPFYTSSKDEILTDIEIPVKVESKTADGSKTIYKYASYDITKPGTTPEDAENNSLALAKAGIKFSTFFNAAGGDKVLNVESLKALKPRRGHASNDDTVDILTIRKILSAGLNGTIAGFTLEQQSNPTAESLNEKIAQSRFTK